MCNAHPVWLSDITTLLDCTWLKCECHTSAQLRATLPTLSNSNYEKLCPSIGWHLILDIHCYGFMPTAIYGFITTPGRHRWENSEAVQQVQRWVLNVDEGLWGRNILHSSCYWFCYVSLEVNSPLPNSVATSLCGITEISPLGDSGMDEGGLIWTEMLQCTKCHREHPRSIHRLHNAWYSGHQWTAPTEHNTHSIWTYGKIIPSSPMKQG